MYIALIMGSGGRSAGCDYTIGCNINWKELDADSMEEAVAQVEEEILDYYGDSKIEGIQILEVANTHKFDLKGWKKQKREEAAKELAAAKEAKDRKDYEELKKKFG